MNFTHIEKCDLSHLENQIFNTEGHIIIKPYNFFNSYTENEIKYFMYVYGIYVLPTTELIETLKQIIIGKAIEIGAGNGAIGRELKIPITDSKMQDLPEIQLVYKMTNQPTVKYASDIEKLDALKAIELYQPDTVIGAFITHKYNGIDGNMYGVQEEEILKKVKRYINIGNLSTHRTKPLLKLPHEQIYLHWMITRSNNQRDNRIFIFNQKEYELGPKS